SGFGSGLGSGVFTEGIGGSAFATTTGGVATGAGSGTVGAATTGLGCSLRTGSSQSAATPPSVLITDSVSRFDSSAHSSRDGNRTAWEYGITGWLSSSVRRFQTASF